MASYNGLNQKKKEKEKKKFPFRANQFFYFSISFSLSPSLSLYLFLFLLNFALRLAWFSFKGLDRVSRWVCRYQLSVEEARVLKLVENKVSSKIEYNLMELVLIYSYISFYSCFSYVKLIFRFRIRFSKWRFFYIRKIYSENL